MQQNKHPLHTYEERENYNLIKVRKHLITHNEIEHAKLSLHTHNIAYMYKI